VINNSKILGEYTTPGDLKGKLYNRPKSKFSMAKPIETPTLLSAKEFRDAAC
jgi:hypothetical protein